jgi:hypothetical protein
MSPILDRTLHGITVVLQLILQFVVKPVIQWAVRTLAWVADNLWTFVAVILMLIFCYERNGVWYDDIPTIAREFLVTPFTLFGTDVLGMTLLLYLATGVGLIYVVRAFGVYAGCLIQWMRDVGVAIITFVLVGLAHLRCHDPAEFVTPGRKGAVIAFIGGLSVIGWVLGSAGGFW